MNKTNEDAYHPPAYARGLLGYGVKENTKFRLFIIDTTNYKDIDNKFYKNEEPFNQLGYYNIPLLGIVDEFRKKNIIGTR